ncbi:tetratricopeptide repeat protein [Spirillospora sp. NPDC048824]
MEPFSSELWHDRFCDALVGVRDAVRARNLSLPDQERRALRRIADHPGFAGLGPPIEPLARGKWIAARATAAVHSLAAALPPTAFTAVGLPADKAIVLWDRTLQNGLGPPELTRRSADLFGELRPRSSSTPRTALEMRIRSVMWLPGNHSMKGAASGITQVFHAITTALQIPDGPVLPSLADSSFDYEWTRLFEHRPPEQRQLVTLLCFMAAAPFPLALLSEGWDALPSPLRTVVRDPARLASLVTEVAAHGWFRTDPSAVTCAAEVQERVRSRLRRSAERTACSFVLRFLRAALSPDTHHHESWDGWRLAPPHVEAAAGQAERLDVRLSDAAYLLDRLSVYQRSADHDAPTAAETARHAVAICERTGISDPEAYSVIVGNLALALEQDRRFPEAIAAIEESLEVRARIFGTEDSDYAGTLSIKGYLLERAKRFTEAREAHQEALATMRRIVRRQPGRSTLETLVEVLNDYAACLRRGEPRADASAEALRTAMRLLDEALHLVERGAYGWKQVMVNRAHVLRLEGRLDEAETIFRDLVDYCEATYGDPSYELYVALRELSELLWERDSPDYDAVYLRAHEVDDAIGPDGRLEPDDPMR